MIYTPIIAIICTHGWALLLVYDASIYPSDRSINRLESFKIVGVNNKQKRKKEGKKERKKVRKKERKKESEEGINQK